jgi:hypothetical protein
MKIALTHPLASSSIPAIETRPKLGLANFIPKEGHIILKNSPEGPHLCTRISKNRGGGE